MLFFLKKKITKLNIAKSSTGTAAKQSSSSPVTARKIRRMVRKKKRDKGTPFSGMASPPIHVLIVEGKETENMC